jgi:hypothetical protein
MIFSRQFLEVTLESGEADLRAEPLVTGAERRVLQEELRRFSI